MRKCLAILTAAAIISTPLSVRASPSIPEDIRAYAEEEGAKNCICPETLEATMFYESSFDPTATNKTGTCKGLMQINESIHRELMAKLGVTDIYDPHGNIKVGAALLADLCEESDGDICEALMRYNGAPQSQIDEYHRTGKCSRYAEKILKLSECYERMHNK